MSEFFYYCKVCDECIFYYGELQQVEVQYVQTDRGNMLVCNSHDPDDVEYMWRRGPCQAKNKDGTNCKYEANASSDFICARHGGGKI
jgi:hypothetical protein